MSRVEAVAQSRLALIKRLIKSDPASVRSVMLSSEQVGALIDSYPNLAGLIETAGEWTGTLEQIVEDDFLNHAARNRWILHTSDGQRMELSFADARDHSQQRNRTLTVQGVGIENVVGVESYQVGAPALTSNTPACSTTGAQNTAVLIMNQHSTPAFPSGYDTANFWTPQYFSAATPPPKSVNTYWQETSFGLTSNGGQIFGPFTLDQNYSCDQTDAMAAAAITIAKNNSVDFSQFTRVSIIFPTLRMSCGFGGLGNVGCVPADGLISHPYSVSWIPVFEDYTPTFPTNLWGLLAHEQGHNLGLAHSNSLDFGGITLGAIDYVDSSVASANTAIDTEYGDPYTEMGGGSYTCGGQYTAFNKRQYLGWLNPASVTEVTTSGSFTVVPFEQNSGVRSIRVLRDALSGSWIWLEYRQTQGNYDSAFSSCEPGSNILQGALGYYESPNSSDGHLFLLDFTPAAAPNNFADSALTPGHGWSDPYSLLTLTANSANSSGISITASYDQPCATLALSAPVFAASGASGSITVTAPGNCSWQASTAASWISFSGVTSGSGNGSVPFTLSNNTGHDQRNSYITIQRQSTAIVQKGTGTFISNLNPVFQSGASKTISVTFEDPAGTNDIQNAQIYIQDYTSCEVYMSQNTSTVAFFIFDNSTGAFTSSLLPGQNATISNANCSLTGIGTTVTRVGNQLQLALNMGFTNAFLGSHRVSAAVTDGTSAPTPPEISLGTFQVQVAASISTVTPSAGKQGFSVPIVITGLNTHFTNSSTVAVSGTGVTSSAITAVSSTQLNATLTITGSATLGSRTLTVTSGTEVVTSPFTVNGTGKVSLSPPSLTFGLTTVGTNSATQTMVLTNNGNAVLNISSIVTSGEFGVSTTCGGSVAVNGQCNVVVSFQPLNYGTRTGSVIINDDGPGNPDTAALTGTAQLSFVPSRPDRTTKPASTQIVITSSTVTVPVEVTMPAVKTLPRVSCSGPKQLLCRAVPDSTDGATNRFNVRIDAAKTPPGEYIVVLTIASDEDKQTVEVPVKVTEKEKHVESPE